MLAAHYVSELVERGGDELERTGIVVDPEQDQRRARVDDRRLRFGRRSRGRDAARQHRPERASLPDRAAHADGPALRLDQALGQRQPEAGPALLVAAVVVLLEFDE